MSGTIDPSLMGGMQSWPLTLDKFIDHAARWHGDRLRGWDRLGRFRERLFIPALLEFTHRSDGIRVVVAEAWHVEGHGYRAAGLGLGGIHCHLQHQQ